MENKPFLVIIEVEIAIFAKDEYEAQRGSQFREAINDAIDNDPYIYVQPLNRAPDGWSDDCLVYGTDDNVTLKEALNWDKKSS